MLKKLKELNPDIKFYDIHSKEFAKYGRVLDIDTHEVVDACEKISRPENGTAYMMSCPELESLRNSNNLREYAFGELNAQIGLCHGYNSYLNGLEYHKSSEINIAATPLVLLLGLEYEMEENEYSSSNVKAFYLEKGDAIEVYSTSLHFCPCQTEEDGFSCVVILPEGTNDVLDKSSCDKLLFRKNKWLICHEDNRALTEKGVYPGIHGENYKVEY